ncbi:uncharacterized protein PV06_09579 [Exophiala oligosperma]|uniref:SNF2 N-terminal domain-containing protein n=1 Tax=Exophiala oligosperma TaxID=215243 RepID=A0A0D2BMI1_9EURO|nr:uncharacterized protein PV06_09579 [Exophiala oligosperma]KIW38627.1 hypothetical protein PV06_09579 [Exophiala oligosperma]
MSVFGVILTAYDTAANRFLRANEMDKEEKLHVSAKIPDRPIYHPTATARKIIPPDDQQRALAVDTSSSSDDKSKDPDKDDRLNSTVWANVFKCLFVRVICDQGHRIKNPSARNHLAVHTLFADYSWIVTATPMANRFGDLPKLVDYTRCFRIGNGFPGSTKETEKEFPLTLTELVALARHLDQRSGEIVRSFHHTLLGKVDVKSGVEDVLRI